MSLFPSRIVGVCERNDEPGDWLYPGIAESGALIPEPGERVIRVLYGEPRFKQGRLSSATQLLITNRRVTWIDPQYDRGGGWVGFGAAGLAVATASNVVSKRRAAKRSAGKVAAGHVRFEWLQGITISKKKALIGVTDTYLNLFSNIDGGDAMVTWWLRDKGLADEVAPQLAAVVAQYLLTTGEGLIPEDHAKRLHAQVAGRADGVQPDGSKKWHTVPPRVRADILERSIRAYQATTRPQSPPDKTQ